MQRVWIDTDTASDDAVALIMALRSELCLVEGISVVAGNVELDKAVQNALYTVEFCDEVVPVYAGRYAPIMRPLEDASVVHGVDGMGDIGLPLTGRVPEPESPIDFMSQLILDNPGEIRIITLGPLSNLAASILRAPDISGCVEHCYIMGGTAKMPGNVNEVAEYNIWADPEAAYIVAESGMPVTFIGWDVSMESAFITEEIEDEIRALGTKYADFAMDIQSTVKKFTKEHTGMDGFDLPDPIAMAVALDPGIAEIKDYSMKVVIGDGITRGQTVVDILGITDNPKNARFVTHVDPAIFVDVLKELLG